MSIPRLINFTPRHIRQLVSLTIIIFLVGFAIHYVVDGKHRANIVERTDSVGLDDLKLTVNNIADMQSHLPQGRRADGYRRMNLETSVIELEPGNTYADIQTDRGTIKLCVYPQEQDTQSKVLLTNSRKWQSTIVHTIESIFACDLDINLIDVGAELGLLSVIAAKWRRRSIAIEASWDNVGKIRQTLAREDIQHAVAVLHNTVFDQDGRLEVIQSLRNRSDSILVQDLDDEVVHNTGYYSSQVNVIYLDDLRPIIEAVVTPKVILRINLADSKYNAFVESRAFFHEGWVNVPYILMKWTWKRRQHDSEAASIITYLTGYQYTPFDNFFTMTRLDVKEWNDWPSEIIWLRDGEDCSGRTDLQEIRETLRDKRNYTMRRTGNSNVKTTMDIVKQAMPLTPGRPDTTEEDIADYKEHTYNLEAPDIAEAATVANESKTVQQPKNATLTAHKAEKVNPVTQKEEKVAPTVQKSAKEAPRALERAKVSVVAPKIAKVAPIAQQLTNAAPVAQEPAVTASVAQEPAVAVPVAQEPAVAAPVAQKPAAPVAQKPAVTAPVAQEPAVAAPVAQEPAVAAPVAQKPAEAAPVAQEPAVAAPVAQKQAEAAPVAQEPAVAAPVAQEPAVAAPVAQKPAVAAPVAQEPAKVAPAAQKPAKAVAVAQEPAKVANVVQEPEKVSLVAQEQANLAPVAQEPANIAKEPPQAAPVAKEPVKVAVVSLKTAELASVAKQPKKILG